MLKADRIALPFYVWLIAFVLGLAVAAGSLSYAPQGRINILWVWLLWAGLPLAGTLVSLFGSVFGASRPWLFQWRRRSLAWYPSRQQRLHMLWLLQAAWLVLGLGVLAGFWVLLLFTDLAFGWSSTLVQEPEVTAQAMHWLALPWQSLWPGAVPSSEMISATQYQRINPVATDPILAGRWWRFLMASLIVYNLLPRLLLALIFYGRWRWNLRPELQVRTSGAPITQKDWQNQKLEERPLAEWQDAEQLGWELAGEALAASFGLHTWGDDERELAKLLDSGPKRLLWHVKASRSPVAELTDLITRAREAGISEQALLAEEDAETDPERHLASWRAFARQHQLVWVTADS